MGTKPALFQPTFFPTSEFFSSFLTFILYTLSFNPRLSTRPFFEPYLSLLKMNLSLLDTILSLPEAILSLPKANLSLPKRYLLSPGGELLSPERYLLLIFQKRLEAGGERLEASDLATMKP